MSLKTHEGRNGRKGIASYISAVEKAVAEFIENNNITAGGRSYIAAVGKAVAEFIETITLLLDDDNRLMKPSGMNMIRSLIQYK